MSAMLLKEKENGQGWFITPQNQVIIPAPLMTQIVKDKTPTDALGNRVYVK